jgi:hypothetical protein
MRLFYSEKIEHVFAIAVLLAMVVTVGATRLFTASCFISGVLGSWLLAIIGTLLSWNST